MNINEAFSSYLKLADLQGRAARVTISAITIEEVGTEQKPEKKPVLYFQGKNRGMVLNRTNAEVIAAMFGPETDLWVGQIIEIWPDMNVDFGGRKVGGIRVRAPQQYRNPPPAPAPTPAPPPPLVPAPGIHAPAGAGLASPHYDERNPPSFDDEIPF